MWYIGCEPVIFPFGQKSAVSSKADINKLLRSCIQAVFPCVPQSQTPTARWKDPFATQPLFCQTWVICRALSGGLPDRAMVELHLGPPLSLLAPAQRLNRQISESEERRGIVSWVPVSCQDLLIHARMRLCLLMLWLVG